MKQAFIGAALVATLSVAPTLAAAGAIEDACLRYGRGATPALCQCIQVVANQTLSASDQREAARFFSDPQRAQDVRMSTRQRDNDFWARYRAFSDAAVIRCTF